MYSGSSSKFKETQMSSYHGNLYTLQVYTPKNDITAHNLHTFKREILHQKQDHRHAKTIFYYDICAKFIY